MAKTPKLGGELPAYTTMGAKKPRNITANTFQGTVSALAKSGYGSKNYVQRSTKENLGTPGNSSPRMPATFRAPRKPAK